MLTELELRTASFFYNACCQFYTIPFEWSNGKLSIKAYHSLARIWNTIIWFWILLTLAIRIILAPSVFGEGEVNRAIPNGLLVLGTIHMVVGKLLYNTDSKKAVLLRIINESLFINSAWGEYMIKITLRHLGTRKVLGLWNRLALVHVRIDI